MMMWGLFGIGIGIAEVVRLMGRRDLGGGEIFLAEGAHRYITIMGMMKELGHNSDSMHSLTHSVSQSIYLSIYLSINQSVLTGFSSSPLPAIDLDWHHANSCLICCRSRHGDGTPLRVCTHVGLFKAPRGIVAHVS